MANLLTPDAVQPPGNLDSIDFKYNYPVELGNLHPAGEKHQKLLHILMQKARASKMSMEKRYPKWREIDKKMTSFIDIDSNEVKRLKKDHRRPVSIVVPLMRAVNDTITSYYMGALLGNPIFSYDGVGPEDTKGALIMSHLVHQQVLRGQGELQLYGMINDSVNYGIGICAPVWDVKRHRRKYYSSGFRVVEGSYVNDGLQEENEDRIMWEGHRLYCIDPYNFLPDPNTPIERFQDSSFAGYVTNQNRFDLLKDEYDDDTDLFNVRYIPYAGHLSVLYEQSHGRDENQLQVNSYEQEEVDRNNVYLTNLFVKMVPSEWELGDSDYPELWAFTIANDSIIVRASRMEDNHGMIPMVVAAPDFDCHTVSPISKMETIFGLQRMADWLLNSYVANAVRVMYNKLLIDPYKANLKDALDPDSPVIRMRRSSWGEGIAGAAEQLDVQNVTQENIPLVNFVGELMQRVTAAPDAIQGMADPNAPERRTAEEYRNTRSAAVARLASSATRVHTMAFRPLAEMMAHNTVQYMSQDVYIKLIGEMGQRLVNEYGVESQGGKAFVDINDIDVDFDVEPIDGMVPAYDSVEPMMQLFQIAAGHPILAQRLDIVRMYKSLARRVGEKNIDDFDLQMVQVAPTENVQDMIARNPEGAATQGGMF